MSYRKAYYIIHEYMDPYIVDSSQLMARKKIEGCLGPRGLLLGLGVHTRILTIVLWASCYAPSKERIGGCWAQGSNFQRGLVGFECASD